MAEKTNPRDAVADMAKSLQGVFKQYSKNARKKAWGDLTSGKGKAEIDKLLVNPRHPLNAFTKLHFAEWMETNDADLKAWWAGKGWDVGSEELDSTLDLASLQSRGYIVSVEDGKPHPTKLPGYSMVVSLDRYFNTNQNPSNLTIVIPYNNGLKKQGDALEAAKQIVQQEHGRYSRATIYQQRKFVGRSVFSDEPHPRKMFNHKYPPLPRQF